MMSRLLVTLALVFVCCVPQVLRPCAHTTLEMPSLGGVGLFSSPDLWAGCSGTRQLMDSRSSWEVSAGHQSEGRPFWGNRGLRTGQTVIGTWRKPTYLQPLRLVPMTLGLGLAYFAYLRYRYVHSREKAKIASTLDPSEFLASNFEVTMYKFLPWRAGSRFAGWVAQLSLPVPMRNTVLRTFAHSCGCNIQEAAEEDLCKYKSLSEFFRRELKPGVRPVHPGHCVVSPADGTLLHFGPVLKDQLEQVKGISYSLPAFLGPQTWNVDDCQTQPRVQSLYSESLLQRKENHSLFQCVIYLAPGDYHRFHSPADWTVLFRRHFPGELLSVRPGLVSWIAGLFNLNERVAYIGEWKHGFFSMVAVGATGVGSIKIECDQDLVTNSRSHKKGSYYDHQFTTLSNNNNADGPHFKKGDSFGEFNFGSTIVLIFEAPNDFEFSVQPGEKVKYGQLLTASASCSSASAKVKN